MTIYLYVKTHNKTGLKYLGKTKSTNPHKYPGSGIYWRYHLEKYGRDVSTQILLETASEAEIRDTGLFFSKLWDVVKSPEWANLANEEGQGGDTWDKRGRYISPETKHRMSLAQKGKTLTEEHMKNMRGKVRTQEFKDNLSKLKKGVARNVNECPHCLRMVADGNFQRWHGDNCSQKS